MQLSSSPNSAPVTAAAASAVSAAVPRPVETATPRVAPTGVVLNLSPAAEASIAGSTGHSPVIDPSSNLLLPARFGETVGGVGLVGQAADALKPGVFQVYENPALREAQQVRQAEQERALAEGQAAFSESGTTGLSEEQKAVLNELKGRDAEVRAHEMSHMAAGSGLTHSASYTYQTGPDGKQYAIGGSVQIDTTPEATPDLTIAKARRIRAAALAPASPSAADRAVAAGAMRMETVARMESAQDEAAASAEVRSSLNPFRSEGGAAQDTAAAAGKGERRLASFSGGTAAVAQLYTPDTRSLESAYMAFAS